MKAILASILLWSFAALGATHSATNLTEADLVYWATHVADGDTVIFPSGSTSVTNKQYVTASINAAVVWTNAVTVLFHEPAVITNKASASADVRNYVFMFSGPSNSVSRIAGVTIDGSATGSGIAVGSYQHVRIDHCNFRYIYGRGTIFWGTRAYGLADRNTYHNCRIVHETLGGDDPSWDDPAGISTGGTNCVVFEANSVTFSNANWVAQDQIFYNGQGAKTVNRFNSITSSVSGTNVWYWDCHGNQEAVPSGSSRGTIYAVLERNTVNLAKSPLAGGVRGGQLIMISNVVNVTSGDPTFRLTDEEGWNTSYFPTLTSNWPVADQITNSFFVGNLFNGSEITESSITNNFIAYTNEVHLIRKNRDYWITNGMPPASKYTPLVYPHPRAFADVVLAASPSHEDVSNAVRSAKWGDKVLVPAGSATWTSSLIITNAVHLIGAGTNATTISNAIPWTGDYSSGWRPPLLNFQVVTNGDVRVSGFRFNLGTNQGIFFYQSAVSGDPAMYSHRVDSCFFDQPYTYAIWYSGVIDGVVDHCTFKDARVAIGRNSLDSVDWNRFTPPLLGLGTTNSLVIEANLFLYTSQAPASNPVDAGQGSHYVFRFNTLDYSSASSESHDGLDLHGNNHLESADGWRGSVFSEVYGNSWNWASHGFRLGKFRGGTSMIFSNSIIKHAGSYGHEVVLDEEEMWANYVYSYPANNAVRTNAPAQDQVTNTFIWANTVNLVVSNIAVLYGASPSLNPVTSNTLVNPVSLTIVEGTDYWHRDPRSAGYTNRSGGVNAMTGYTPLVYPHPRVSEEGWIQPTGMTWRLETLNVGSITKP